MHQFKAKPDFSSHQEKCADFLRNFRDKQRKRKYWIQLEAIANRELRVIEILLDDLKKYFANDSSFLQNVEQNTIRYLSLFSNAIDGDDMPKPDADRELEHDVFDILADSRAKMEAELRESDALPDPKHSIPSQLTRRYEIRIVPSKDKTQILKVRGISSSNIGGLITVQGIVTRVTDVRPLMRVATYICDICGNETYQVINKKQYTPLTQCPNDQCQRNRNQKPLIPQSRGSRFEKFQELKLQELPEEVPEGNVPRSVTVYIMGELTRQCTCGDKITISGIWLPLPHVGFRAMRAGLTTNTYLHCMSIYKEKKAFDIMVHDKKILNKVDLLSRDINIYSKLSRSIAPEIYGLEDVKKALLLLLVAGVTKETKKDKMKIRGDINILLMGDPGVAKSQLLKHITTIAPRSVYTTGKGSSGVGLTAAVIRDPITRDMTLEGGALVLSDMGICCIDEFDKMEESDRTAIHEVMEQQTISIAKAGITTTLNARTAILAAANPAFGRYDKSRSPEQNINLPAALLSRFDLLFVLVDKPDIDNDIALARHITHVHQHNKHPKLDFIPFKSDIIRAYITKARTYNPIIPKNLTQHIVSCYVELRNQSLDEYGNYDSKKIVGTPRALLSILRISQSLARLRFSSQVNQSDVTEAIRLISEAKKSTLDDNLDDYDKDIQDSISKIYSIIRNYFNARNKNDIKIADLNTMLTTRGFSRQQIDETLDFYHETDVWLVSNDRQTLSLVQG